ncbi:MULTISPECIES: major tail protein [Thermoactinomyces]|uniref:Phage tail protein n=1 Tax=Thermoactinomyces daqus TaxID=1329516 RepID=A0A7W1XD48_9BACL|nr:MULTISPECIES: major tail protein [Thermoactinomyces]MBA4544374.1 phage tail protein [Thermoactinomyces daqus]MBH8609397.1 phage tail protein [Thermoactinomyces sp. CICC 10521]
MPTGVSTSAFIGLKDLYFAVLTKDDSTGATYNTPEKLAPAVTAKITPNVETATDYGDDGPVETATSLGAIEVEFEITSLPLDKQATLLGHTYANGMLVKNVDDIAPYVALGYRSPKSDGSEMYVWLYKGKFQPVEMNHNTKADKVEFQHPTIKGNFVVRNYDGNWSIAGDTSDSTFQLKDIWFQQVIEPDTQPGT